MSRGAAQILQLVLGTASIFSELCQQDAFLFDRYRKDCRTRRKAIVSVSVEVCNPKGKKASNFIN